MQAQQQGEKEGAEGEAHALNQMMRCASATQALYGVLPQGVAQPAAAAQSSLVALEPTHSRRRAEDELEAALFFAQLVARVCHRFS